MNVEIPMELAEWALVALKFCDREMDFAGYRSKFEQLEKIIIDAKKSNKDAND